MTVQLRTLHMAAGAWAVSDSRTRVTFTVQNLGRTVHGAVTCSQGQVQIDDAGAPMRVRAELDLNTLDTGIGKRDLDLRKPRFLDIDREPTMTWSADRFARHDDGSWVADGRLSVRGTSVPLVVSGTPEAVDGGWVRVRASAVLDRRSVGIRAPRLAIGRIIGIGIDAWLRPVQDMVAEDTRAGGIAGGRAPLSPG
jgi:polyisoprenoid-binding protein YceI